MTKLKLNLYDDYSKEYSIIGISCHLKDYRLIYNINKELNCDLKKYNDLVIYPIKGKIKNSFSFYSCTDDFIEYNIIANRNPEGFLFTKQRQIDYILILKGPIDSMRKKSILNSILKIPGVLTSFEIMINSIQNLDVILSDLEIHLLKISKDG